MTTYLLKGSSVTTKNHRQPTCKTALAGCVRTADVARNITGVRAALESSAAATAEVLSSARDLSRQAESLRFEMDRFLATVRAA